MVVCRVWCGACAVRAVVRGAIVVSSTEAPIVTLSICRLVSTSCICSTSSSLFNILFTKLGINRSSSSTSIPVIPVHLILLSTIAHSLINLSHHTSDF
ncbi:hypothetical protein NPIL_533701 [Nephila pilipes]|uniref:Secreted protein n=1 Tax=Nephila pilipes TaxID=299642 RepID=A0A8X6QCY9_NEPPI|nr:hypothetical protein NPIL_533701 [Nephila pilipes]